MMTMTLDNGPHREMAVDVPDSFIASSKTPPRYPPPRTQGRLQVHSHCKLIAVWQFMAVMVGYCSYGRSASNKSNCHTESPVSRLASDTNHGLQYSLAHWPHTLEYKKTWCLSQSCLQQHTASGADSSVRKISTSDMQYTVYQVTVSRSDSISECAVSQFDFLVEQKNVAKRF